MLRWGWLARGPDGKQVDRCEVAARGRRGKTELPERGNCLVNWCELKLHRSGAAAALVLDSAGSEKLGVFDNVAVKAPTSLSVFFTLVRHYL
jgi:hypothetical protein